MHASMMDRNPSSVFWQVAATLPRQKSSASFLPCLMYLGLTRQIQALSDCSSGVVISAPDSVIFECSHADLVVGFTHGYSKLDTNGRSYAYVEGYWRLRPQ
ncbi:hypothetical protein BDW75DRAFT_213432 [Aspergillus navahoensis]